MAGVIFFLKSGVVDLSRGMEVAQRQLTFSLRASSSTLESTAQRDER